MLRYNFQTNSIKRHFVSHLALQKSNIRRLEVKQIAVKPEFIGQVIATNNMMPALFVDVHLLSYTVLKVNKFIFRNWVTRKFKNIQCLKIIFKLIKNQNNGK